MDDSSINACAENSAPFSTSVSPDLSDSVCISKIDHSMSHERTGQEICGKENAMLTSNTSCPIAPSVEHR